MTEAQTIPSESNHADGDIHGSVSEIVQIYLSN